VTAIHTAAADGIGDVITLTDLDDVGRDAAAGPFAAALPGPAIIGDEAAGSGAKGVIFAIRLSDGRRIVDEGLARKLRKGWRDSQTGQEGKDGRRPAY
jgi:hypothetical protein